MKFRYSNILINLSLVLIGIAFVLAISELFLRLNPKFGYRYQFFNFRQECLLPKNVLGYLRPSPLLGYEHIPNCKYRPDINSYGLMGKEYKLKKDKGVYRILILGDSIAEKGHINKFLEDDLSVKAGSRSRFKFEVWNSGVASYDVRRYAIFLKHKGLSYDPDMVILFLFMNDFGLDINIYYRNEDGTTRYYFPISEISKIYTPSPFLMRHSYLYRFSILNLNSFLSNERKVRGKDPNEENGRYYLGTIKEMCEKNDIPLFIVIFPYLKPLNLYDNAQSTEYAVICKVVEDLKIPYYNLHNLYEKLLKENFPLREAPNDEIHPSKETFKFIAEEISNYVIKNIFNKR